MGLCEGILGVKQDYEGLRIEPAFPSDWDNAELTRRFRGADYEVSFRRTGTQGITVDGRPIEGTLLPDFRDGKTHLVEVTI